MTTISPDRFCQAAGTDRTSSVPAALVLTLHVHGQEAPVTPDRPTDPHPRPREITLTTVANPRRTKVDADGRPEPVPAAQRSPRD